jgi:hypothetical protein
MYDVISETTNAEKQFDFLEGEWNAICRFPLLDGSWGEGPGSLTASKVLDGCVSPGILRGTLSRNDHQGPRSPRLQSANLPVGTYVDGHVRAGWLPGLARTI